MNTKFMLENLRGRDRLEDQGVGRTTTTMMMMMMIMIIIIQFLLSMY